MSRFQLKFNVLLLVLALFSVSQALGQTGIRLNEVFANNQSVVNPDGSISDWVEFYNNNSQTLDLSGARLTDDLGEPNKWVFPPNSTIPGNGLLVVLLDKDRRASTTVSALMNAGFSLSASGDTLYILSRGASPTVLDSVSFGIQAANYTLGRSGPTWTLTQPTPGALNVVQQLGNPSALRVNEWMARPISGDDWFEIYNTSGLPIQLTGLFLTDNPSNKTNSPVAPRSFIGTGRYGYAVFYADGNTEGNPDHVAFSLRAEGESIGIYAAGGIQIDLITYGAQTAGVAQGRLPDASANIVSLPNAATPGEANYMLYTNLLINEVLSHTDPPFEDAVEFYNPTSTDINISGWFLSDNRAEPKKYRVPNGTIVPAKGYAVLYEYQFNGASASNPFSFNSARGDEVWLAEANANGELTGRMLGEAFEPAERSISFGRHPTSVANDYKFVSLTIPTFGVSNPSTVEEFRSGRGALNAPPRIGPIVVNEVMFRPFTNTTDDNVLDEFIELYNATGATVPLYDPNFPTNRWRLRDGVSFTFPPNTTLGPFSYALVVSFDPVASPNQRASFVAKYSVPPQAKIFGPYIGRLDNDGDPVELYKPDVPQPPTSPDAGLVPYVRVDKVNYLPGAPWPGGADGTGKSIQKKNPLAFGNDPTNWEASNPTAGQGNSPELADNDGDGMPNVWETQHGFNPENPADANQDADNDGLTNIQEYIAGTHPKDANSRLVLTRIVQPPGTNSAASITFQSVAGKSYSLQSRNSLQPHTLWNDVKDVVASGSTVTIVDTNAVGRTQRFYRVVTPSVE